MADPRVRTTHIRGAVSASKPDPYLGALPYADKLPVSEAPAPQASEDVRAPDGVLPRWLSIDPGETTGWALWEGQKLLETGQDQMWPFADELYAGLVVMQDTRLAVTTALGTPLAETTKSELFGLPTVVTRFGGVQRIVIEEFALYPPGVGPGPPPPWDKVLTARLIGAIQLSARIANVPVIFQGANIKRAAVDAGAETLFEHPLHENRHQNDAIMHGVFWMVKNQRLRHV